MPTWDPVLYKEWYRRNRDKVRVTRRLYYLRNQERLKAKQRAYNLRRKARARESIPENVERNGTESNQ